MKFNQLFAQFFEIHLFHSYTSISFQTVAKFAIYYGATNLLCLVQVSFTTFCLLNREAKMPVW